MAKIVLLLARFVKELMAKAGYEGYYTNHSLRVYTINTLRANNVPDSETAKRSGHASLVSVAHYVRDSDEQDLLMSRILSAPATAASKRFETEREDLDESGFNHDDWTNTENFECDDILAASTPCPEPSHKKARLEVTRDMAEKLSSFHLGVSQLCEGSDEESPSTLPAGAPSAQTPNDSPYCCKVYIMEYVH